jgi:Flp pilus assembly protein TadG
MRLRMPLRRRRINPATARGKEQCRAVSEEGSAILETALSSIILLTFLFGIMETGVLLYVYHFLSHAARETARYAIVRGSSCTGLGSACPATQNDIMTYATTLGFSGITTSDVSVSYAGYPAGAGCIPNPACNNPGNMVTVTITYDFPFNVPFIPANTFAMSSTSSMIISQ